MNFKIFETDDNGTNRRFKCIRGVWSDCVGPKCEANYTCPDGYWERLYKPDANLEYRICEPCPVGCKTCDVGNFHYPGTGLRYDIDVVLDYEGNPVEGNNPSAIHIDSVLDASGNQVDTHFTVCRSCLDGSETAVWPRVANRNLS